MNSPSRRHMFLTAMIACIPVALIVNVLSKSIVGAIATGLVTLLLPLTFKTEEPPPAPAARSVFPWLNLAVVGALAIPVVVLALAQGQTVAAAIIAGGGLAAAIGLIVARHVISRAGSKEAKH